MKTLETGQDKIDKICDTLRKEALEPAEKKAIEIIDAANQKAEELVRQAEKRAEAALKEAKEQIDQERSLFESSLFQAAKLSVETLRQEIETKLFNPELRSLIASASVDPHIVTKLIESLIQAIEKQGIQSDLLAYIPSDLSPQLINSLLTERVVKKLANQTVSIGPFKGGAYVKLVDRKMTIDMTDAALEDLIAQFIQKDFRKYIFKQ